MLTHKAQPRSPWGCLPQRAPPHSCGAAGSQLCSSLSCNSILTSSTEGDPSLQPTSVSFMQYWGGPYWRHLNNRLITQKRALDQQRRASLATWPLKRSLSPTPEVWISGLGVQPCCRGAPGAGGGGEGRERVVTLRSLGLGSQKLCFLGLFGPQPTRFVPPHFVSIGVRTQPEKRCRGAPRTQHRQRLSLFHLRGAITAIAALIVQLGPDHPGGSQQLSKYPTSNKQRENNIG